MPEWPASTPEGLCEEQLGLHPQLAEEAGHAAQGEGRRGQEGLLLREPNVPDNQPMYQGLQQH